MAELACGIAILVNKNGVSSPKLALCGAYVYLAVSFQFQNSVYDGITKQVQKYNDPNTPQDQRDAIDNMQRDV